MKKTIFVLGAGNGCGNRVAEKFGKNDFRVILMARNEEHLAAYEKEFQEKGIEVYTKVVDAAKPYMVTEAFNEYLGTLTVTDVIAPGEKCDPVLLAEDFWKLYTERTECEMVH